MMLPSRHELFASQASAEPVQKTDKPTLKFTEEGTFQLTVFSDLHMAEDEDSAGPIQDKRTVDVMTKVLDNENPQLVVLNGDLVSGYGTVSDNATEYIDQIVGPMVAKDLPWATTYGNHDNEDYSRTPELLETEQAYSGSLTKNMISGSTEAGVSNYYLPVYAATCDSHNAPELILWFFDSRGGDPIDSTSNSVLPRKGMRKATSRPDWVDESVVQWFRQTKADLAEEHGQTIPSLAFFHIPLTAAWRFQKSPGVSPSREPGINGEEVCWQGQETFPSLHDRDKEFMKELANTDGLLATFSGHDHDNDWCFKWTDVPENQTVYGNGLNVCYDRHTGYGGYGQLARGGRQVLLHQDTLRDEAKTWVRLESGQVPETIVLNATFGQDEYHPSIAEHLELKRDYIESLGSKPSPEIISTLLFLILGVYLVFNLWA